MPYHRPQLRWRPYLWAWASLLAGLVCVLLASGCQTGRSGPGGPDVSPSNPDRVWP